jgi:molybdate transport system ATP-binding protein
MEAGVVSLSFAGSVDLGRFTLEAAFGCETGETIALVGPNGAGKSTALTTLAGLLRLTSGSLTVDGRIVDGTDAWVPPDRRRLGVVFQDLLLFPHLSVLDNVAYGPRRGRTPLEQARSAAMEQLDRFGVADLAHARPRTLSGGQAQRVALARALACTPRVLLLDEPLSALDAETRMQVRCELHRSLDDFDGYTFMVAHDVVDVLVLADRVVVFEHGRVAQISTPSELERHPRTRYAAALVGTNLLRGERRGRVIELGPGVTIPTGRPGANGPVDVVVSPRHVTVSAHADPLQDGGTWIGTIAGIEAAGDDVHIRISAPVPISARASIDSLRDLHLTPGARVHVRIDPDAASVFDDASRFLTPMLTKGATS